MKKNSEAELEDDLRPEYDFHALRVVARGPGRNVYYPESDGEPMAETEVHREVIIDLIKALQTRYEEAPDVYVGGNLLMYYVEGDPRSSISPDVFVVKKSHKGLRDIYKLWEEQIPCLVFEITSKTSKRRELGGTKEIFEFLGIEEYVRFNPVKDSREPQLQGFRLVNGRYEPIVLDGDGCLLSRATGLKMRQEGWNLRLIDARTGKLLEWDSEVRAARRMAEERAEAAEAEVARLRTELKRLRQDG